MKPATCAAMVYKKTACHTYTHEHQSGSSCLTDNRALLLCWVLLQLQDKLW